MSELTAEEKLFAVRTENQKLMEKIMLLEGKVEQLKKIKKSGKIRIVVDQLLNDLKFMKEGGRGDTYVDFIYHDDNFVRLDSVFLVNAY